MRVGDCAHQNSRKPTGAHGRRGRSAGHDGQPRRASCAVRRWRTSRGAAATRARAGFLGQPKARCYRKEAMELLVYARNYRALGSGPDAQSHRDLGVTVGEAAPPFSWGERLCSFVEVRLPRTVIDPSTEIELLVAKAFAAWGHPGAGRVLRFSNTRGRVSMLLEPGFERTRDLCHALRPVLPKARVMLERAMAAPQPLRPMAAPAKKPVRVHRPLRLRRQGAPRVPSLGAPRPPR